MGYYKAIPLTKERMQFSKGVRQAPDVRLRFLSHLCDRTPSGHAKRLREYKGSDDLRQGRTPGTNTIGANSSLLPTLNEDYL